MRRNIMTLEELILFMKNNGILHSEEMENALKKIKRVFFVPEKYKSDAYHDYSIPIGHDQSNPQPSVVVTMTEMLDVRKGQKILEVGAGSGWHAAILGHMVGEGGKVYSIEIYRSLAEFARKNIRRFDLKNVEILKGDGTLGLKNKQPFDRILISGAVSEIPEPLKEQLAEGGKLVAPVGNKFTQQLVLYKKVGSELKEIESKGYFNIEPLMGKYGFKSYWW